MMLQFHRLENFLLMFISECPFVCNFVVKLAFDASVLAITSVHDKSMVSVSSTLISPSTKIEPHL